MARGAGVIGLSLTRAARGGSLEVDRVAPGGPAALADIRPGDRLLAIDDEPTRDLTIHEAARLVRGPVDTAVELRIRSPRDGARLITLVRVTAAGVWEESAAPREHRRRCERMERRDEREDEDAPER
jgi:C-terminal processing protease CtpA/Prc